MVMGSSGEGVWHMHLVYVQRGSWKWAWSRGKRVGRQRKWRETNTEQKRVRRLAPGTGRFPAHRGRASLRRTDSWCSACSPPGSSRLSPGGQTRLTKSIKWKKYRFAQYVSEPFKLDWVGELNANSKLIYKLHRVGLIHCSVVESSACSCLLTLS